LRCSAAAAAAARSGREALARYDFSGGGGGGGARDSDVNGHAMLLVGAAVAQLYGCT